VPKYASSVHILTGLKAQQASKNDEKYGQKPVFLVITPFIPGRERTDNPLPVFWPSGRARHNFA
jgi:hypothetical protein